MARFTNLEVYNIIIEQGLIPVFYNSDFEIAKQIIKAIVDGGCKIVEFTNRGDFAYEIFGKLVKYFEREEPQLIFGIGSIVDSYTATLYINNGTNFIVSPILNPKIAKLCNKRGIPYSPGCGTLSEISKAEELGCVIVKLYPADLLGGPDFVKSILAPMPWVKIMPTGGLDIIEKSINAWFNAGVVAVGIGSKLITKESVNSKNWSDISKDVENVLKLIKESKKKEL